VIEIALLVVFVAEFALLVVFVAGYCLGARRRAERRKRGVMVMPQRRYRVDMLEEMERLP
jgi:uncharacterized membrane protein YhaH (DUF805 family)